MKVLQADGGFARVPRQQRNWCGAVRGQVQRLVGIVTHSPARLPRCIRERHGAGGVGLDVPHGWLVDVTLQGEVDPPGLLALPILRAGPRWVGQGRERAAAATRRRRARSLGTRPVARCRRRRRSSARAPAPSGSRSGGTSAQRRESQHFCPSRRDASMPPYETSKRSVKSISPDRVSVDSTSARRRRGAIQAPEASVPNPSQLSWLRNWWRLSRCDSGTEKMTSTQPSARLAGSRAVRMRRSPSSRISHAFGVSA